jgi:hypothetical protein
MNLEELLEVKSEIERFNDVLNESIDLAGDTKGWESSTGEIYGANDIAGTRQCGHLKREYLSLKFNLNKII